MINVFYLLNGYYLLDEYTSNYLSPSDEYYKMHLFLYILSLVSLVIGIHIGGIGYKSYKANKDKVLLILCTGFFLIALSNIFEDLVLNFFEHPVENAHLIRIPIFTLGMIMILYSLKMK